MPRGLQRGKWSWSAFPPLNFPPPPYFDPVSRATEVPKMQATVMKDDDEKLIELKLQFLYELMIGTLFKPSVLWYLAPKSGAFFWIFFSRFFPRRESIEISSYSCHRETARASFDWFGAKTFLLKNQNEQDGKTDHSPQLWIDTRHLPPVEPHTDCRCVPLPHLRHRFLATGVSM